MLKSTVCSSRVSAVLFWSPLTPGTHAVHRHTHCTQAYIQTKHTYTHIHLFKNNILSFFSNILLIHLIFLFYFVLFNIISHCGAQACLKLLGSRDSPSLAFLVARTIKTKPPSLAHNVVLLWCIILIIAICHPLFIELLILGH